MRVGVFHPPLNVCGGAEIVAITLINSLKKSGHQTVVLTNEQIDQRKIKSMFGDEVNVDQNIVFPLEPFPTTSLNNIYTDCFRTMYIKRKCDVLIDTQSNGLLPGVNITYIHHPIFGRLADEKRPKSKVTFYLPYRLYERTVSTRANRLVFSNSKYTTTAIRKFVGIVPQLLYPPIAQIFFDIRDSTLDREDVVISVSRISPEKSLTLIPSIARLTNNRIRFLIVGMKQSEKELNHIYSAIEKNKVSNRVEVILDVSRAELVRILRSAKVFLHPARGEHFGVSVAEAMASGCIPIVRDSGGPAEFVPDDLRFNGVRDAARIIDRVILEWSPKYSKDITDMAQTFSESNFSKKFLSMFNSFIERKSRFSSSSNKN